MGQIYFATEERLSGFELDDCLAPLAYSQATGRTEHLQAEQNLMHAILIDAVRSVRLEPTGSRAAQEAEAWIMDSGLDHVFSFEHICDVLGLDASYLRRGLAARYDHRKGPGPNRPGRAAA